MSTAHFESCFADVNGARLYYEILGSGHPLVLLHAGIADCRMWDDQLQPFAERFRVVRYDARGFGRSDMPAAPYSHVEDLAALLDHLGVDRASFVGASMGGGAELDFALTYPERVAALVLVGSAVGGRKPSKTTIEQWNRIDELAEGGDLAGAVELELRMWVDGPRRSPDQVDRSVRERVREMDAALFARPQVEAEEQELDAPAISRLGEIHAPTLVLAGEEDVQDIVSNAEVLATSITGARRVVLADTAHLPNMERPEEFNRLVLDFLTAVAARS